MASLISPCGPAKIWKKQYENYISFCFTNEIYYIKNICQVFLIIFSSFQFRLIRKIKYLIYTRKS